MLFDTLQKDFKEAMKARNVTKKEILSFVIAQLKNKKIDTQKDLSDDDVMQILKKEIKTRKESLSYLKDAGKDDEVTEEEGKIAVLQTYLPTMLTAEELKVLIEKHITNGNVDDLKTQRGKLIGLLMKDHRAVIDGQVMNDVINSMI